ncbi:MAG TPA: HNH endonuclease signature motif containing protein [Steroidobacteraceae bacterium]
MASQDPLAIRNASRQYAEHDRDYGRRWRTARARFLRQHPLCTYCQRQGFTVAATCVDHIVPHRGDLVLFWDETNWQSLCQPCHDGAKAELERTGKQLRGCDAGGAPVDPQHPWAAEDNERRPPGAVKSLAPGGRTPHGTNK